MRSQHKLDDKNFIVLSNQKEKIKEIQSSLGPLFLTLSLNQQKDLITCYPQIILSFPAPRSKELILTAISIDYTLINEFDLNEIDDEIMTLAIENCQSFSQGWGI